MRRLSADAKVEADAKVAGVTEEYLNAFRTQVESTIRTAPCETET